MKFCLDVLPIVVFFLVFYLEGNREQAIYSATAWTIAACVLQAGAHRLLSGRFEMRSLIGLAAIIVLGGFTLALQNKVFIKWKPTAVYWLFALLLCGSRYLFQRNPLRGLLGKSLHLPDPVWDRLNLSWAAFFLLAGALNLYVAYRFSDAVWVNFKLFGFAFLTLVVIVIQAFYLARFLPKSEPPE